MFKYNLAISFLCLSASSIAGAAVEPLSEVSQVVELPDISQKKIFDLSKIWLAKNFKSSNSVIQYEDAATGTIIGKGNMPYPCSNAWKCMAFTNQIILFTLTIDTKDNKARLTFNDLRSKSIQPSNNAFVKPGAELQIYSDKEGITDGIKKVISEYGIEIKKVQSDTNW